MSLGDRTDELFKSFRGNAKKLFHGQPGPLPDISQPGEILTTEPSFPLDLALPDSLQEPALGFP